MSSFTDDLLLSHMSSKNWRLWRIERELAYEIGNLGSGKRIVVPAGFLTDGASVPRFLWAFLPSWGRYSRAAVVHDYLCYRIHLEEPHPEAKTRRTADAIFYEAMRVSGTGIGQATFLWIGARLGAIYSKLFPGHRNIVTRVNRG